MALEDFKPQPGGKGNSLLSPATVALIHELAARAQIELDPTQFTRIERGGKIHYRYNASETPASRAGGGGGGVNGCPFGEIIDEGEDKAIRGGTLQVGDKNFDVPAKVFSTGTSGSWLVFLRVPVTVNIDDAGEILLPGVETSTATDPAGFWELDAWSAGPPATQYEDNTRPVLSTGVGEIIIGIGKLTVAAGVGTLAAARCGNIIVNHCAGTLTAD
jgi:hypothetical protein